jgi:hypothetical protein
LDKGPIRGLGLADDDPGWLRHLLICLRSGVNSGADFFEVCSGIALERWGPRLSTRDFEAIIIFNRFWITLLSSLSYVNFALTLGNKPAPVPPLIQADDVVFFIKNATAPVILRPLNENSYHLVGVAYIRGLSEEDIRIADIDISTVLLF